MSLWAITSLFNPAGFRSRGDNYRVFREHLKVPLVAVELAFDAEAPFALGPGDAEILVQRRGGARLWQKERLLNLALAALPAECDAVVAIDADVLVHDPAWPSAVAAALERDPVVQPYAVMHQLDARRRRVAQKRSTIAEWTAPDGRIAVPAPPYERFWPSNGHVWAARRDVLARHGFYDGCIIGGGDTVFMAAAIGCLEFAAAKHVMGAAQERRYRAWAAPFAAEVAGHVGFVPAEAEHLWHGTQADRRWEERHQLLRALEFDPYADIRTDDTGVWQWDRAPPELRDQIHTYFLNRNEDVENGPPAPTYP